MARVTEYTTPSACRDGRQARIDRKRNNPPATLTWAERHWWLAGWGDADMELCE
jgi:hypothetical protein